MFLNQFVYQLGVDIKLRIKVKYLFEGNKNYFC